MLSSSDPTARLEIRSRNRVHKHMLAINTENGSFFLAILKQSRVLIRTYQLLPNVNALLIITLHVTGCLLLS